MHHDNYRGACEYTFFEQQGQHTIIVFYCVVVYTRPSTEKRTDEACYLLTLAFVSDHNNDSVTRIIMIIIIVITTKMIIVIKIIVVII